MSAGWKSKIPPDDTPKRVSTPWGCERCRGHGHADGFIGWRIFVGSSLLHTVVTKCFCAGGKAERPPLKPTWSCEEELRGTSHAATDERMEAAAARLRARSAAPEPEEKRGGWERAEFVAPERPRGPG